MTVSKRLQVSCRPLRPSAGRFCCQHFAIRIPPEMTWNRKCRSSNQLSTSTKKGRMILLFNNDATVDGQNLVRLGMVKSLQTVSYIKYIYLTVFPGSPATVVVNFSFQTTMF